MRRSELILIVYFCYTAVLSQVLPLRPPIPRLTLAVNAAVIAGFLILAWAYSLRKRDIFSIMRDWYPVSLMLLAYREIGWFAPSQYAHDFERAWESWDRVLLNEYGLRAALEALGPVIPNVLELSYLLVYPIPSFGLAVLYLTRHRERADRFLVAFLLGILICYTLFPLFPSEPPRTAFPGQDLPTHTTPLRRLNLWLLGGYGIHTSVFPSAHVAGAFSAAFTMLRILPERRRIGWFLLFLAISIALATVYGRYHYAADASAGFVVSLAAQAVAAAWDRRSQRPRTS